MANAGWKVLPPAGELPPMIVHADAPVAKVTGVHNRFGTVEEIVAIAEKIKKSVEDSKIHVDDVKGRNKLLKRLQDEHKDFTASFPVPLRWMVQADRYNKAAFVQFLEYYRKATEKARVEKARTGSGRETVFDSRQHFLEVQAEYGVILEKTLRPHLDEKKKVEYRRQTISTLIKEDKELQKLQEEAAAELKKKDEEAKAKEREALLRFVKGAAAARPPS